jgi:peptidyl-prolyl cis-trans isomerase SurA
VVQPLSEVREDITKKLIEEERIRMQDRWIDTLREKAYVKIY